MNFQLWRHIGHCLFNCCKFSHLTMQCMWKQWEHTPHTRGQSSPGSAHSGQVLSKDMRQMPQFSSFAIQRQDATPVHDLIVTFILCTFAYHVIEILMQFNNVYVRICRRTIVRFPQNIAFFLLPPENRSTVVMCFFCLFLLSSQCYFSRFAWDVRCSI